MMAQLGPDIKTRGRHTRVSQNEVAMTFVSVLLSRDSLSAMLLAYGSAPGPQYAPHQHADNP